MARARSRRSANIMCMPQLPAVNPLAASLELDRWEHLDQVAAHVSGMLTGIDAAARLSSATRWRPPSRSRTRRQRGAWSNELVASAD